MAVFGKGRRHKTSNEKFVIAKGVDAGNLKGRGTAPSTAPMHKSAPDGPLSFPEAPGTTNFNQIRRGRA